MKVLVTGAGGFLGKHLAQALVAEGHEVYNYSRSTYAELEQMGVTCLTGDLGDYDRLAVSLAGMEAVFHVASKVGIWGKYEEFYQTNVVGTENIIRACLENKISKLIYTSTPSVVFGKEDLCGVNELAPYPTQHECYYAATKAVAEKKVLAANSSLLATVALRPHLIFGPGDHHLFPRIVESAKMGKLKRVGEGKNLVDVIYVKNAVDAHLLALGKLSLSSVISGKAYFIAQERPVNLWGFVDQILDGHGVGRLTKSISASKAYKVGKILEKVYSFLNLKKEPPMTGFVALQLSKSHYFSHKKAEQELGYIPKIGLDEAMSLTLTTQKQMMEDQHVTQ